VSIDIRRNVKDFPLAPCLTKDNRREVEQLLVRATGSLAGKYQGLAFSQSRADQPGVSEEEQHRLCGEGLLFSEPTATIQLAAGVGRDWPDARGSFVSEARDVCIWSNEEDHLRIRIKRQDCQLKKAFSTIWDTVWALEDAYAANGSGFVRDDVLGYLTVNPANIGCAMTCIVTMNLILLGRRNDFQTICEALELKPRKTGSLWEVSNGSTLGISEVDVCNEVLEGCVALAQLEALAASGEDITGQVEELTSKK